MGVIPMPPPGLDRATYPFCNAYNDPLFIDVQHPGYFAHSVDGLFNPELPDGFKPVGKIGPLMPTANHGDLILSFFDTVSNKTHLVDLKIRPTCP